MATVSGIKVFKDSIKFPALGGDYILQAVDYSCPDDPKSTSYHSMLISSSLIYSTAIDFSGGVFTTVYDSDGWANTYYKTVDFGEAEQTVDDVFFSWLDENIVKEPETKTIRTLTINGTVTTEWNGKPVKQVTVDGVTYKMPETYAIEVGTYVGNDTITTTAFEKVGILFSCDGVSYYGMERTSSQLRYYLITDLFNLAYEKSWENVSYRTIQVEKYVTENESFYNWFTANYLPYEEPATYTIEAGTYQAKEELGTTSNFNIDLNFTSNGQSFSDMNTSGITRAPEATFNYDSQIVYMIDTKTWINDNYRTIVIDTAQTVTDESFYNWFTANYLPYEEPETSLITVRYTENTVAGTVTITNRSDFAGYVEVTVSTLAGASIYITTAADTSEGYYKLEANQTRTLNVGGDWPEQQRGDDLIATVTPVLYVEPTLITFTINGIEYQAEEGMTWSEWVESSYNTGSNLFYKSGSTAYIKDMMYEWCVCYDSAKVVATDVIIAGAAYDLME